MVDADVDRLLLIPPFCRMDADGFRTSLSLRDILKNDVRIVRYVDGEIVVRSGDWGNTAFSVLEGSVRVDIEPPESAIPSTMLGRGQRKIKTVFQAVAQLWSNHREPEYRSARDATFASRMGSRGRDESPRIYLQDVSVLLDQYRTARIDAGGWFGELAALGRTPRVATVFAEGPVELLEIRWQGLRDIMRFDREGGLKKYIEDVFRERALAAFLRNDPVFRDLNDAQMDELAPHVEFETYGNYDTPERFKDLAKQGIERRLEQEPIVASEGDYPNGIILIRSGLARLSKRYHHGHRTVGYLTPGQSFGYQELAEGHQTGAVVPLRCSLRAIGYLNVVVVPTFAVEQFLLTSTEVTAVPQEPGETKTHAKTKEAETKVDDHLLDFLADHRFVQGTATMIIDLDRCTRCDDCVRACSVSHDSNPRFIRHGPVYGRHMLANACLHCADPVCMIECPTGAIHRDQQEGLIVINEQTCIGCTNCANNCPFDAIRMVEIRDRDGRMIVDDRYSKPLMQATKCDLCIDQLGGPACQTACPHDALFRVDMRDFERIGEVFVR